MFRKLFAITVSFTLITAITATPMPSNDFEEVGSLFNNPSPLNGVDYNTVVGHFKDFLMYLPVMMTTVKESMAGFPKFAEGIRVLVSPSGRADSEDCRCKGLTTNEIDNNSMNSNNSGNNINRFG